MDVHENQHVHNLPVPNIEAMREHLEHLFGGYLNGLHNGLIELAWTDTFPDKATGKYKLRHAQLYETSDIDSLVKMAVIQNQKPMCNVYVGAALRKPNTAIFGRADRSDFYGITSAYADLDEKGPVEKAKDRYGPDKPTMVVVTGREPHTRAQMWWRLSDPITDPDASESLMRGIEQVLEGDNVYDAPRVMRLAGSVAWPHKPGRVAELTYIKKLEHPGQREYAVSHLEHRFPPVARINGAVHTATVGVYDKDAFGFDDKLDDGRDVYTRDTLTAVLVQLIGETGACPTPQELFDVAWPQYQNNAKIINSEGKVKGGDYVAEKCKATVRRFMEGKISTVPTIDVALESYQRKKADYGENSKKLEGFLHTPADKPLILTGAEFLKAFKPPDYLVDGIMQRSGLYAMTARTGHGKTAVAMHAALCVARGIPFHSKPTEQGSVLFFAGENSDDIRARYTVMLDIEKANVSDVPLYFIDGVINIRADMERIRTDAAAIPNLSLVIIDTKQAYFLGDDGNSNEQQVQFARLGRDLIKLPGHPAVVFLCHPIKNAGRDNLVPMGGSAFLNEIDFNFTLWAEDKVCKLNPHPDKWRGPVFEEMAFELKQQSSARLKDSKGREIPSVIVVPISEMGAERREAVADDDEKQILRLIHADKNASFSRLAERAGWKQPNGDLAKSRVARVVARLLESKFVYRFHKTRYRLTKKGCKHVELPYGNSEEDE